MIQMDEVQFEKLIERLYDFVFIEERIVTCVWLSDVLKVHANTAKQLLHAFFHKYGVKDKPDKLLVTYIIGGILKDDQGIKLKLVKADEREQEKNQFSVLTTDHIYSIQKSATVINSIDIFNSFSEINLNPDNRLFCPVKPSKEIEKREIKLIVFETKKESSKPSSKPAVINDSVKHKAPNNDVHQPPAKQSKKSPENNKTKVTKGGIIDMFNKQNEKKKSEAPASKIEKRVEVKKAGGISGFLQKQPPKKQEPAAEQMEVDDPAPIKEKQSVVEKKEVKNKINEGKDSPKPPLKEKKTKGKENRKKRKKRDEKEDESRKKRKRIATVFSSDSDSSDHEVSDCEMEPEPPPANEILPKDVEEEDIIPPTPTPGRKRVRKQIDKTYTDEDGYILTKKEYVYESCTDDEATEEKKDEPKEAKEEEKKVVSNDVSKPVKKEENKKPTKKSPVQKKGNNDKSNNKLRSRRQVASVAFSRSSLLKSRTQQMEVDDPAPIKEKQSVVEKKEVKNKINEEKDSPKPPFNEKKTKGKENRKKRKKRDEKEDESRKKRKRIATVFSSDSDSSDHEVSDCEMEPEPPPANEIVPKDVEEEEDIIPPTPTPGRKRVRKQIDKTYTDEDGYILTKKEYVYESCTDDEATEEKKDEPKEAKEEEKKVVSNDVSKPLKKEENKKPTKKSPVQKKGNNDKSNNKQASIMSFFKKK